MNYGEKQAVNEISSILESQWKNGMLPHIRFKDNKRLYRPDAEDWGVKPSISGNKKKTSGITQPPILAWGVWQVYNNSKNKKELKPFLEEWYPKILKYHEFLLTERDPENEHLAAVIHPWETGLDNSMVMDQAMLPLERYEKIRTNIKRADTKNVPIEERPTEKDYEYYFYLVSLYKKLKYNQKKIIQKTPFLVQDVLFNVILANSLKANNRIAKTIGEKPKEKPEKICAAIKKKMWDPIDGFFYGYDMKNQRRLWGISIQGLMPLMQVADKKQKARLMQHLKDPDEFWPKKGLPVPSLAMNTKSFINYKYWKGPVWPVTNWLLVKATKDKTLKQKTLEMIQEKSKQQKTIQKAKAIMEHNRQDKHTTPSKKQYYHAWLWDSVIAAIGWSHIKEKPDLKHLKTKKPEFKEYYSPITLHGYKAGEPLGAEKMTWTAAVYLDLTASSSECHQENHPTRCPSL